MKMLNALAKWWMSRRIDRINHAINNPLEVQQALLKNLISKGRNTAIGRKFEFKSIRNIQQFQQRVPVHNYEDLHPYIERMLQGERQVLWPSSIGWYAKTSGTTSGKSKLIPVSQESLKGCHYRGGKDMLALYARNYPDTRIFTGKNLSIGGGQKNNLSDAAAKHHIGNISAIVMQNLPFWAQYSRTPDLKTTMMENWEEKVQKIAKITSRQKVASMAGSPIWLLSLLHHMLDVHQTPYIQDIWPELEVFFHGGVSLMPYRAQFEKIDRNGQLRYMNIYNASEGFFGMQDRAEQEGLLLMLDYGVFYEFIPEEDFFSKQPKVVDLSGVEVGKNYSLLITTNSGLWRYKLGDSVRFLSTNPFRFTISGRTKHCINVFSEDLYIEQAERALEEACRSTEAILQNYTVAPRFYSEKKKGCHEWVVEFKQEPNDLQQFTSLLDSALKNINDDYAAKRKDNMVIEKPVVHQVPAGTFYAWFKKHDKLGGQHKVPRLSNSREYLEDILSMEEEVGLL